MYCLDIKNDIGEIPNVKSELQADVNDVKPGTTQMMYSLVDIKGTHFIPHFAPFPPSQNTQCNNQIDHTYMQILQI